MKKCPSEIMKEIRLLEQQKEECSRLEHENSLVTYTQGEEQIPNDYDYFKTTARIEELDKQVANYKHILNVANVNTLVDGFELTISDALIYLAQLTKKKYRLESLASHSPLKRLSSSLFGKKTVIEYQKTMYDVEAIKKDLEELNLLINKLQMALDRTNLTVLIDC